MPKPATRIRLVPGSPDGRDYLKSRQLEAPTASVALSADVQRIVQRYRAQAAPKQSAQKRAEASERRVLVAHDYPEPRAPDATSVVGSTQGQGPAQGEAPAHQHTSDSMVEMAQASLMSSVERRVASNLEALGVDASVSDALIMTDEQARGQLQPTLADFVCANERVLASTDHYTRSLSESIEFLRVQAAEMRAESERVLHEEAGFRDTLRAEQQTPHTDLQLLNAPFIERFLRPPARPQERPCVRGADCIYPKLLALIARTDAPGQRLDAKVLVPAREFLTPHEEAQLSADPTFERDVHGQCFVCAATADAEDALRAATDYTQQRPQARCFYRVQKDVPDGFRDAALLPIPGGTRQYILKMSAQQFELGDANGVPCLRFCAHMLHEADFRRAPPQR